MPSLFEARMKNLGTTGGQVTRKSTYVIENKTFKNSPAYRDAKLYDANMNLLQEHCDIKFKYSQSYTINKDQVEWLIRFRPEFYPEKVYKDSDGHERLGYYLEFNDEKSDTKEKWLVLGKNDKDVFVSYNVLKCNWVFKWIADGVLYQCLGCLRDRNNYNSGIWSDGFIISVEDQSMFIVPTNDITRTLDFDMRFMLSDNVIHPNTYAISKRNNTTPIGISKIVLKQDHYNPSLDNAELGICDYYTSVPPIPDEGNQKKFKLECSGLKPELHLGGSKRTISVIEPVEDEIYTWNLYQEDKLLNESDIQESFVYKVSKDILQIKANADAYDWIGKILKIEAINSTGDKAYIELEVIV